MQHIDEALLHEYLDRSGESVPVLREIETHLEGCASCRARLDEVSTLRASASDILRAASPEKRPVPSFEEVAALMGAPIATSTTTVASRKRNRMYELAWAATVVLALGAGWMANSLYRSGALDEREATSLQDGSEPTSPREDGIQPEVSPNAMAASSASAPAPRSPSSEPGSAAQKRLAAP